MEAKVVLKKFKFTPGNYILLSVKFQSKKMLGLDLLTRSPEIFYRLQEKCVKNC